MFVFMSAMSIGNISASSKDSKKDDTLDTWHLCWLNYLHGNLNVLTEKSKDLLVDSPFHDFWKRNLYIPSEHQRYTAAVQRHLETLLLCRWLILINWTFALQTFFREGNNLIMPRDVPELPRWSLTSWWFESMEIWSTYEFLVSATQCMANALYQWSRELHIWWTLQFSGSLKKSLPLRRAFKWRNDWVVGLREHGCQTWTPTDDCII